MKAFENRRLTPREEIDLWSPEQRARNLAEHLERGTERRGSPRVETAARKVLDELFAEKRRANLLACDLELAQTTSKALGLRVAGLIDENRELRQRLAEIERKHSRGPSPDRTSGARQPRHGEGDGPHPLEGIA